MALHGSLLGLFGINSAQGCTFLSAVPTVDGSAPQCISFGMRAVISGRSLRKHRPPAPSSRPDGSSMSRVPGSSFPERVLPNISKRAGFRFHKGPYAREAAHIMRMPRPHAREQASGGWVSAPGFRRVSSRERRLTIRQTRYLPIRRRRCPCLTESPCPSDRRQLLCCCRCPCPWSRCPRSFLRHQRLLPYRRPLLRRRRPEQEQARRCPRGKPWP